MAPPVITNGHRNFARGLIGHQVLENFLSTDLDAI